MRESYHKPPLPVPASFVEWTATGPSSYRLFEVMRAGRVPVFISDSWVRPEGPDWDAFVVFVKEREVGSIPMLLRERENEWRRRGRAARIAFDDWYSRERAFHSICSGLRGLGMARGRFRRRFFGCAARMVGFQRVFVSRVAKRLQRASSSGEKQ